MIKLLLKYNNSFSVVKHRKIGQQFGALKALFFLLCSLTIFASCKKLVEVDPPKTQLAGSTVFSNDITATASIIGIYNTMISSPGFISGGPTGISLLSGLLSDEFKSYSFNSDLNQFYTNSLSPQNINIKAWWATSYKSIYYANTIIEELAKPNGITPAVKKQLEGEAKFIRAFCHFYLVNLFGDIPIVTTTDYEVNAKVSRSSKEIVYQQIINDLIDAKNLLGDNYVLGVDQVSTERTRPNKAAATALLARVYLYTEDWPNAEEQSTAVIGNIASYQLLDDLNTVFLKNSAEAIWQLEPLSPGYNTYDGYTFILTSGPNSFNRPVTITDQLAASFDPTDKRTINWIGINTVGTDSYNYAFKYQIRQVGLTTPPAEYLMVLRLAEQYLIRAEARAQQNKITEAQADLDAIRSRAGLPNTTANDKATLLAAIANERKLELFSEWGHRWFDLKRTGQADAILSPVKGTDWQPTDVLLPIPILEMQTNKNLTQNLGYN